MVGKLTRCLLAAALGTIAPVAAADTDVTGSVHREAVDVASYPWSAIGKLFNEAGGSCTGAIIARDKILTAAHCVYNERTRRFLPASALHFMVGYRSGQAAVHARVASYEMGAGYDPLRWTETMDSDWVILTLTENLPEEIAPLKLSQAAAPAGTRAIIAGYPQDRAHKMTADRDCALRRGRRQDDAPHLPRHARLLRRADPGQRGGRRDPDRRHPRRDVAQQRGAENVCRAGAGHRLRAGARTGADGRDQPCRGGGLGGRRLVRVISA